MLDIVTVSQLRIRLQKQGVLTSSVEKAILQAESLKTDQLERHIFPVTDLVINACISDKTELNESIIIGSLLHDSIEDDPNFTKEKCITKFGEAVYRIIKPLTKKPEDNLPTLSEDEKFEINRQSLDEIKKSSTASKIIKLADRANLSYLTVGTKINDRLKRYIRELTELYIPFAKQVSPCFYKILSKRLKELLAI